MGVVSSFDATSSLRGRKVSPDADPKGKKSSKDKTKKTCIMRQSFCWREECVGLIHALALPM